MTEILKRINLMSISYSNRVDIGGERIKGSLEKLTIDLEYHNSLIGETVALTKTFTSIFNEDIFYSKHNFGNFSMDSKQKESLGIMLGDVGAPRFIGDPLYFEKADYANYEYNRVLKEIEIYFLTLFSNKNPYRLREFGGLNIKNLSDINEGYNGIVTLIEYIKTLCYVLNIKPFNLITNEYSKTDGLNVEIEYKENKSIPD